MRSRPASRIHASVVLAHSAICMDAEGSRKAEMPKATARGIRASMHRPLLRIHALAEFVRPCIAKKIWPEVSPETPGLLLTRDCCPCSQCQLGVRREAAGAIGLKHEACQADASVCSPDSRMHAAIYPGVGRDPFVSLTQTPMKTHLQTYDVIVVGGGRNDALAIRQDRASLSARGRSRGPADLASTGRASLVGDVAAHQVAAKIS